MYEQLLTIVKIVAVTIIAICAIAAGQYALMHGATAEAIYLSSAALIAFLTATFAQKNKPASFTRRHSLPLRYALHPLRSCTLHSTPTSAGASVTSNACQCPER